MPPFRTRTFHKEDIWKCIFYYIQWVQMSDHLYSNMHIIQRESLLPLFANQVVALEVATWQMRRQKFISLIGADLICYNLCFYFFHGAWVFHIIFDKTWTGFKTSGICYEFRWNKNIEMHTCLKSIFYVIPFQQCISYSKFHAANMGLNSVLLVPDEPHVGPMNLAIRIIMSLFVRYCIWYATGS